MPKKKLRSKGLNKIFSFTVFNTNINIHLSFVYLFASALPISLTMHYPQNLLFYPLFILFYTLIIIIHEFGHVFFIKFFKYEVLGINLHIFGGDCHYELPYFEKEQLFIAAGGVIFQLIVFIFSIIGIIVFNNYYTTDDYNPLYNAFFVIAIVINPLLVIANLIPIEGNDGFKIKELFYIIKYKPVVRNNNVIDAKRMFEKMMKDAKK